MCVGAGAVRCGAARNEEKKFIKKRKLFPSTYDTLIIIFHLYRIQIVYLVPYRYDPYSEQGFLQDWTAPVPSSARFRFTINAILITMTYL